MTTITNQDPRHPAKIFRGTGQDIAFVCEMPPLCARTFDDDGFYWADTGRVSFDEIDATVATAWERSKPAEPEDSAGARMLRRALREAV